jgi:hypothetical protein
MGDIEKRGAVHITEVDRSRMTGDNRFRRTFDIERKAQRAGKIVGRPPRNDADRQPSFQESRRCVMQGPIAAGKHDRMEPWWPRPNQGRCLATPASLLYLHRTTGASKYLQRWVERLPAAAGVLIDDQEKAHPVSWAEEDGR